MRQNSRHRVFTIIVTLAICVYTRTLFANPRHPNSKECTWDKSLPVEQQLTLIRQ